MKPRTPKSIELYNKLLDRGYPREFCEQVSLNLNTDWTAQRMLGYLSHYRKLPRKSPMRCLRFSATGTGSCKSMSLRIRMRSGTNL